MKALAGLSLLLVILLVALGAYARMAQSGIGCPDWPQCYGRIAVPEASVAAEAGQQVAWAGPLHRGVAIVVGVLVLLLALLAFYQQRYRLVTLAALGLAVWLAMLGLRPGSLHDPAMVMGTFSGGFAMLALLGWLWFSLGAAPPVRFDTHSGKPSSPRTLLIVALAALCLQILLGGLTSANFAANACDTVPLCQGEWLPGPYLMEALDLSRQHEVTAEGLVAGGEERIAINRAHRLMAVISSVLVLMVAQLAMRRAGPSRRTGMLLLLLIVVEFSVGVASVMTQLSTQLAVAHNWLAGLLLLALLRLFSLGRPAEPR